MSFASGTTLAHYKVLELLGSGGMGEVFKATDTKLDRPVALKVLPPTLVSDPERVRRFVGEARAASALNHPHIVTIYEIGEALPEAPDDGNADDQSNPVHYIAMEYVSGATLHTKIHRDKAELKRLLEYFAQAADGLAKAHAAGIVHRDLKPDNIMVTDDGYAKILDFGLAKLVEPENQSGEEIDPREAATAVMERTRAGVVMGTIGYMSPEQTQGKSVDQRSDVFSFGCILYEAATRLKPFQGDSMIDSLHKIVYAQPPPIRDSNPEAPTELQRIIRKCLAKDPGERYQSIKDIAIDLRELLKEYDSQPRLSGVYIPQPTDSQGHPPITAERYVEGQATAGQPVITSEHVAVSSGQHTVVGQKRTLLWLGLGLAVLGLAIVTVLVLTRSISLPFGDPSERVGGPIFQNSAISKLTSSGRVFSAVISPDGKYTVHIVNEAGNQGLWVRQTATSSNVQIVPPDDGNFIGMTFSQDGNYVYYVKGEKGSTVRNLFQVPVLGGAAKKLIEDVDSAITFSPDAKRFAFVRHSPAESSLIVVNADGSNEQKLLVYKQPDLFLQPAWSPDGKTIAASTRKLTGGFRNEVVGVQVSDGTEKTIGTEKWLGINGVAWEKDSSSLLLCAVDQTPGSRRFQIWELGYADGKTRRITNDLNNYAGVTLSADSSTLVTVQSDAVTNLWIVPGGDSSRARQITSGSGRYDQLSFTPDGRLVYLTDAGGSTDIWIMDADGRNQRQLTSDAGVNFYPAPCPDGRYLVFCSNRGSNGTSFNVWRMGVDGGSPRQITRGEGEFFPACSPDGKSIFYTPLSAGGRPTLWRVSIDGGDSVQLTERIAVRPVISHDGKWVACQSSTEQPNVGPKVGIFLIEGGQPVKMLDIPVGQYRWSADSKSILYLDEKGGVSNIWSQGVDGGAARQLTDFTTDQIFSFDSSRDGKQMACARGFVTTDAILIKDKGRAASLP